MDKINYARAVYRASRLTYRLMTSRMRLLPDFLILGGQRCGTTSLYFYLTERAGVVPALQKEVHFFDDHFARGLNWYRAQFPSSLRKYSLERLGKGCFLTGESSPYYLFHPRIPGRVAEVLPHVKLIVLLRNPIDRAYSHHWLEAKWKTETLPFEEAIHAEAERLAGEREKMQENEGYESYNYRHFSYLSRGIYADQLRTWMNFFPKEQFLILKSEDLYHDPIAILQETLAFLDLPADALCVKNGEFKQYREPNPRGYKLHEKPARMTPQARKYLAEYFRPHNARLREFLGRDFQWDE